MSAALQLVDELRAAGRITTVEANALRQSISPVLAIPAVPAGPIRTLDDIYDHFDGPANVGRAIGKTTEHAWSMRTRGSIPVRYWPALIAAARDIGLELDEALLVKIHLGSPVEERAP